MFNRVGEGFGFGFVASIEEPGAFDHTIDVGRFDGAKGGAEFGVYARYERRLLFRPSPSSRAWA